MSGLWAGFAILILGLVLSGFLVNRNIEVLRTMVALQSMNAAAYEMQIDIRGIGSSVRGYLHAGEPAHRTRALEDATDFTTHERHYDSLAKTSETRRVGQEIGSLYHQYIAAGNTLMNAKDAQDALMARVSGSWTHLDDILDEHVHPDAESGAPLAPAAAEEAGNIEEDVAEVGRWLGAYLQSTDERMRKQIFVDAEDCRSHFRRLRALIGRDERRREVDQAETIFDQSMTEVSAVLEMNDSVRRKEKTFNDLSARLIVVLGAKLQRLTFAELSAAEKDATRAARHLRRTSIALLAIGLTITCGAMAIIIGRSRQLEISNRGLQNGIAERERAEAEIRASREELRAVSARMHTVREEERKRIAREIHDELGQLATGMTIELGCLEKTLSAAGDPVARSGVEKVHSLTQLAGRMAGAVRRIATELRHGLLDDFGLIAALEWEVQELQRRTGIKYDLVAGVDDAGLDPALADALFHIAREALTNVARHAEASSVSVVLDENEEELVLQVEDNGKGMPQNTPPGGRSLGVLGMRERAMVLGGSVEIAGGALGGTRVTAKFPTGSRPHG